MVTIAALSMSVSLAACGGTAVQSAQNSTAAAVKMETTTAAAASAITTTTTAATTAANAAATTAANAATTVTTQAGAGQDVGNKGGAFAAGSKGDGKAVTETDPEVVSVINAGADKFTQATYEDSATGISLEYSLYVPADYDSAKSYPLIMYIPDASGASKTAKELVQQYFGADIWVTDEEQAKHASFVLVPAFSEIVVDDNWTTSKQIDAAVNLIHSLSSKYSIDTDRLYTPGQSMGCMTSL